MSFGFSASGLVDDGEHLNPDGVEGLAVWLGDGEGAVGGEVEGPAAFVDDVVVSGAEWEQVRRSTPALRARQVNRGRLNIRSRIWLVL